MRRRFSNKNIEGLLALERTALQLLYGRNALPDDQLERYGQLNALHGLIIGGSVFGAVKFSSAASILKVLKASKVGTQGLCSFHGDTRVLTDRGPVPIRDVNADMSVLAKDARTGAAALKRVLAHYFNPYDETVSATVKDI